MEKENYTKYPSLKTQADSRMNKLTTKIVQNAFLIQ